MSVVYMLKLEEEPDTYESGFTKLTKGINIKVQDWILEHLQLNDNILEVGSGPGTLALKMAKKSAMVTAIDTNPKMIEVANKLIKANPDVNLTFHKGLAVDLKVEPLSYDIIVNTFMLSELRPLEQQIFLREAWKSLKSNGRLIIAAEFVPSGFSKVKFKIKRWRYRKKLRRLRLGDTHPLKWFHKYIEPIGFKIISEENWGHGAIKAIELQKVNISSNGEPGYYRPPNKTYKGNMPRLRILRYLLAGGISHVPIEPGIYESGNPTPISPVIVTANYDYTYIRVMKDLEGIDAWVLAVDSRGINVWCAARGGNFGNSQLIEAVKATDIREISSKKNLILPQLSGGGVSMPKLYEKDVEFPFKVRYGPVWSEDLPQYLKNGQKTEKMRLAKFTLKQRMKVGLGHTSFLIRKIFLKFLLVAMFIILTLALFNPSWFPKLIVAGEILLAVIIANFLLALLLPITNFTRKFVIKGYIFGALSAVGSGLLTYIIHQNIIYVFFTLIFYFWIGFFSTMSFSGSTMATSPTEIAEEYPLFKKINKSLLIVGIILLSIGVIFY